MGRNLAKGDLGRPFPTKLSPQACRYVFPEAVLRMGILVTQRVFTGTLLVWIDGWGIEPQNLWTPNAEGTPQNPNQREAEKRCRMSPRFKCWVQVSLVPHED